MTAREDTIPFVTENAGTELITKAIRLRGRHKSRSKKLKVALCACKAEAVYRAGTTRCELSASLRTKRRLSSGRGTRDR
jgi:hypothetical protein